MVGAKHCHGYSHVLKFFLCPAKVILSKETALGVKRIVLTVLWTIEGMVLPVTSTIAVRDISAKYQFMVHGILIDARL